MTFLRWIVSFFKELGESIFIFALELFVVCLDGLVDEWNELSELVRHNRLKILQTIMATLIFAVGFHEVLESRAVLGYFLILLSIIPGLPALRFLFNAWREGAQRSMEWHRTGKGW
ncbi:MAG: hypothetical protein ACYC5G_00365 [Candidatus Doudnabacteria bacterium]